MTVAVLDVIVDGEPRAQGSARWIPHATTGRIVGVKSAAERHHRQHMIGQLITAWEGRMPLAAPVDLLAVFALARPKGHYKASDRTRGLRRTAPAGDCAKAPDLDKMLRLVGDALTNAGVIDDDRYITRIGAHKLWAGPGDGGWTRLIIRQEATA